MEKDATPIVPDAAPEGTTDDVSQSLTLTADQAAQFADLQPGDEVTFTVASKDEDAGTIVLNAVPDDDAGDLPPVEAEVEDEPEDEEKVLGYKRPQSKKEAPKLSAKDLAD